MPRFPVVRHGPAITSEVHLALDRIGMTAPSAGARGTGDLSSDPAPPPSGAPSIDRGTARIPDARLADILSIVEGLRAAGELGLALDVAHAVLQLGAATFTLPGNADAGGGLDFDWRAYGGAARLDVDPLSLVSGDKPDRVPDVIKPGDDDYWGDNFWEKPEKTTSAPGLVKPGDAGFAGWGAAQLSPPQGNPAAAFAKLSQRENDSFRTSFEALNELGITGEQAAQMQEAHRQTIERLRETILHEAHQPAPLWPWEPDEQPADPDAGPSGSARLASALLPAYLKWVLGRRRRPMTFGPGPDYGPEFSPAPTGAFVGAVPLSDEPARPTSADALAHAGVVLATAHRIIAGVNRFAK